MEKPLSQIPEQDFAIVLCKLSCLYHSLWPEILAVQGFGFTKNPEIIREYFTYFLLRVHPPSSLQELEELSLTDHQQQLEMQTTEFEHLCATIEQTRGRLEGLLHV